MIEEYVRFRRENPNAEIPLSAGASLEWFMTNQQRFEDVGLAPDLVVSALSAEADAISELSLRLAELLIERRSLSDAGETQLVGRGQAISDSLVGFLIAMMLDAITWNNSTEPHPDLFVLIKHVLGADRSVELRAHKSGEARNDAIFLAAQLELEGIKYSMRGIAEILKVNVSTISRWFEEPTTEQEINRAKRVLARTDFGRSNSMRDAD